MLPLLTLDLNSVWFIYNKLHMTAVWVMNVWWGVFHMDSKTLKLHVCYSGILVLDKLYIYIYKGQSY